MHIFILIFSVLSFIAVWYWRLKVLQEVARDGRKAVETVSNLPRRLKFKRRAGKRGMHLVTDPREAATALMLEIAQVRGPLTEVQNTAIRAEIMHHFEFKETDAETLIQQVGWLVRGEGPSERVINRMTDLIQASPDLGPKQIVDLDGMLVAVTEAEGSPTSDQMQLLELYRKKTGLKV